MKGTHLIILGLAVVASLATGGVAGFFAGVWSTQAGQEFLKDVMSDEQTADVTHPKHIVRERFKLDYPGNWKIDVNADDFDADESFSIDSPGNAFVMFAIGAIESVPLEDTNDQIKQFEKLFSKPVVSRFDKYGKFTGSGAIMKGKMMGMPMTVKIFSVYQDGVTAIITQQCPDEDLKFVQEGLTLVENSLTLMGGDDTKGDKTKEGTVAAETDK